MKGRNGVPPRIFFNFRRLPPTDVVGCSSFLPNPKEGILSNQDEDGATGSTCATGAAGATGAVAILYTIQYILYNEKFILIN